MRGLIFGSLLTASLALGAAAAAQDQPPKEGPAEIVVTGTRAPDKQISDFIGALTKARVDGQLSRFEDDVCPAALGLVANQNQAIAARMRSVARAAGIPLGKEGCAPNVFVLVASNKDAVVADLNKRYSDPLGDRVKPSKQSDPATIWQVEGRLDANGIPAAVENGYYKVEMAGGSSRIRPASRPHFLASVLVVEPGALAGLTTTQLADYAAMRLFARTDPSRLKERSAAPTILTVLDAPMGSEVPITLTQWDLGFLKALYGSGENRYASQQRAEMKRILGKELEEAQKQSSR
jgi:hypothetical protein